VQTSDRVEDPSSTLAEEVTVGTLARSAIRFLFDRFKDKDPFLLGQRTEEVMGVCKVPTQSRICNFIYPSYVLDQRRSHLGLLPVLFALGLSCHAYVQRQ